MRRGWLVLLLALLAAACASPDKQIMADAPLQAGYADVDARAARVLALVQR